jgi:hypothetical protein
LNAIERLEEIAKVFDMKPEDVLSFDEKYVFHNSGEIKGVGQNIGPFNNFPVEMKKLYEDNIRLHEEKNKLQAEMIEMLREKLNNK